MKQYDIVYVRLDPTVGSEIRKTRPCLVISPDEMNAALRTVQVAPLTSNPQARPWRIPVVFHAKHGRIALDQIRTIDKSRLVKAGGRASPSTIQHVKSLIHEMLVA